MTSTATPQGLSNDVPGPLMAVRTGAASPVAVLEKTVTLAPARLATMISLFTVSTATPRGLFNPVVAPVMVRSGAVLPFASRM